MEKYDHIVSLGYTCAVAGLIRQIGRRNEAYPFDHIWCPMWAVTELINNDFHNFFHLNNIKFVKAATNYEKKWIYDERYDTLFDGDWKQFRQMYKTMKNAFHKRYKRLKQILNNANVTGEKVLFIRWEEINSAGDWGEKIIGKNMPHKEAYYVKEFSRTIKAKYPNLDFKILFINHTKKEKFLDENNNIVGIPSPSFFACDWRRQDSGQNMKEKIGKYSKFFEKYL